MKQRAFLLIDVHPSRAIHTPGHTTDHLCYWLEEEHALFSGDTVLGQGTTEFEDLYDYLNSLKLILDLSPKVIYPGHGPVVENPRETLEHYISHRQQRNEQILAALRQSTGGLDPSEITRNVYKVNASVRLSLEEAFIQSKESVLEKLRPCDQIRLLVEDDIVIPSEQFEECVNPLISVRMEFNEYLPRKGRFR